MKKKPAKRNGTITKSYFEAQLDKRDRDLKLYIQEQIRQNNKQQTEELRYYFDAALENIIDEMRGANEAEISSLKDARQDHEGRITTVEQKIGLRP